MSNIIANAYAVRANIEAAVPSLDDKAASITPELFPALKGAGELVTAGTRINWKGTLKRAAVDLWDTAENNPDNAPTIWEDIEYRNGFRIIPETITAGLAFAKDEKGWWGETLYKSLLDANVWTPAQHAAGWQEVAYVET